MSLTQDVKAELNDADVRARSAQVAEVAALLRFAGTLDAHHGKPVLVAEVDSATTAARLARFIDTLFRLNAQVRCVEQGRPGRPGVYQVCVREGVAELIRRTGLVTRTGVTVVGLPPQIIAGTVVDKEAAWRGAFLAGGTLAEPGRASTLEVGCPCVEAALALVGCARGLGVAAKTRQSRGVEHAVVRDAAAIGALLSRMGAHRSRLRWDKARVERERQAPPGRLANFDDANLRRSAHAAELAALRVERAIEILGDDVPEHLAAAGQLRVRYRQASLEELGKLADPPVTKDAIAGRIRRLLATADRQAVEQGIPDTMAATRAPDTGAGEQP